MNLNFNLSRDREAMRQLTERVQNLEETRKDRDTTPAWFLETKLQGRNKDGVIHGVENRSSRTPKTCDTKVNKIVRCQFVLYIDNTCEFNC